MISIKITVEVSQETSHSARLLSSQDATFMCSDAQLATLDADAKQQVSFIAGRVIAASLAEANDVANRH